MINKNKTIFWLREEFSPLPNKLSSYLPPKIKFKDIPKYKLKIYPENVDMKPSTGFPS